MVELTEDTVFDVEAGNEISMVPDGCMIYQPSRERVHYLNPTALIVYELCGAGRPVKAIEAFISMAYGLAASPSEAVHACVASLVKEGLIRPCPPSSSER
jgi:hypothetical protein